MSEFWDRLQDGGAAPAPQAPASGAFWDRLQEGKTQEPAPMWQTPVTGRGRVEDPALGEFSGDYLPGLRGLGYELGAAINPSDRGLTEFTVKQLEDDGAEFKTDQYGNPMVMFPKGSEGLFKDAPAGQWMYLNKPGASPRDLTTGAVTAGAFTPASAMGNLAMRGPGGAMAGSSALRGAATGAGFAGATQGALDLGAALTGNTENLGNTIPGVSIPNMLWGAVSEFIPDMIMGRLTRNVPPPGTPGDLAQRVERNQQASAAAGIPLSRGQAAGFPGAMEMTRTLSALPETSYRMTELFENQNEQAMRATQDVVQGLGGPSPLRPDQLASDYMQDAAQASIQTAQRNRTAQGRPIYQESVHQNPNMVDTGPMQNLLHDEIGKYPPGSPLHGTLTQVQRWLGGDTVTDVAPDGQLFQRPSDSLTLEQAHQAQHELLGMAQEADRAGNANRARVLGNLRDQVVGYIEDVSPRYREARTVWRDLSVPVEELEGGVVGRIANMEPMNLESFYGRLFNPVSRQAQRVRGNLRGVLNAERPGAYEAIRQEYMDMLLSRMPDVGSAEVPNVPAAINRALFRTKAMRDMWAEGNPDYEEGIEQLSRALDQAGKGRHIGSPTATRTELIKNFLTSKVPQSVAQFVYRTIGGSADTGMGLLHTRRNQAIRQAAVDREVAPQDQMAEEILRHYLERPATTNPMLPPLVQGARVPMGEATSEDPNAAALRLQQLGY